MQFKKFRELNQGDRFIDNNQWAIAQSNAEPIDDLMPDGTWKVYTQTGRALSEPDATVSVRKSNKRDIDPPADFFAAPVDAKWFVRF